VEIRGRPFRLEPFKTGHPYPCGKSSEHPIQHGFQSRNYRDLCGIRGLKHFQSIQNWDASLSYRKDKDSKWEFEVRATNILEIGSQVRNSANNLSVFVSETFIQPRFLSFRFIYTL
jgi:hypothetical protein